MVFGTEIFYGLSIVLFIIYYKIIISKPLFTWNIFTTKLSFYVNKVLAQVPLKTRH